MCKEAREECIDIIEKIFEQGDVLWYPRPVGAKEVRLLADREGYWLESVYGPKLYGTAEAAANALFEIDCLDNNDDDHWDSVRKNLNAII